MERLKSIIITFLLTLILLGCSDEEGDKTILINIPNYVPVSSIDKGDHIIVLFQKSEKLTITEGYNDLYLMFRDEKKQLKVTDITFSTKTYMMTGNELYYGATFPDNKANSLKIFPVPTYFTKSENNIDKWFFEITYKYKNKEYKETMQIDVSSNIFFTDFTYDNKEYFISQINPINGRIGVMDFDMSIIEKEDGKYSYSNNFTTTIKVTDGVIETNNNAAPIFIKDGFYKGTIYVPNIGGWEVECDLFLDGVEVYKHYYPILIKTEQ